METQTLHVPDFGAIDPTTELCKFVHKQNYEDLPDGLVQFAKRHLLDAFGVTIGGSSQNGIAEVVEVCKQLGGTDECRIPFWGVAASACSSALALGAMSRALDLGDAHLGISGDLDLVGHTSEYTFPAMLAATSLVPKISGKDFILAFILGQEVIFRIGGALRNSKLWEVHGEGVDQGGFQIYGAVVATSKILNLDLSAMHNALGIAKGMTIGHDAKMYNPTTLMVRVHHGLVAQAAILACMLAREGVDGPQEIFGGKTGIAYMYTRGQWEVDTTLLSESWGKKWHIMDTSFKQFTSCRLTHTSATSMLRLKQENRFGAGDMKQINVVVSKTAFELCCQPIETKWKPATEFDAQFSLPYVIATVAYDDEFFIEQFQTQARARQEILDLMQQIDVAVDDNIGRFGCRLEVITANGHQYAISTSSIKGDPEAPLSDDEYREKFRALCKYGATPYSSGDVEAMMDILLSLEHCPDLNSAMAPYLIGGQPE